jgi:Domain of unknown function (DUF222)
MTAIAFEPSPEPCLAPLPTRLPRPLERLEADIVRLCSQLSAATCQLLVLIGEFDAAEGWREWGMRSTAQWLSWQCGIGKNAAREQIRVARIMREFPAITTAFSEARLSYSKVRAITRVVTASNVETLIGWAEHATAAQIERVVASGRRVLSADDVKARKAARQVSWRWDDDGSLVGNFRLSPEDGAKFLKGLEVATDRLPDPVADVDAAEDDGPPPQRTPMKSRADALVAMAELTLRDAETGATAPDTELSGQDPDGLPGLGPDRFQLVIHTTPAALTRPDGADDDGPEPITVQNGPRLHPAIGRRISCGCPYAIQTDDSDGNPLHLGRKTRRIRGRLARAVHHRDHGHCQAPGCTNRTTEIHHIWHWADGGPTCLTNLISLCDAHHWLVHDGGWRITGHSPATWTFHTPDGRTLRATPDPTPPTEPLPHNPAIRSDAVTGKWAGEHLDLHAAVEALCRAKCDDQKVAGGPSMSL